jgi:hypothetical protein
MKSTFLSCLLPFLFACNAPATPPSEPTPVPEKPSEVILKKQVESQPQPTKKEFTPEREIPSEITPVPQPQPTSKLNTTAPPPEKSSTQSEVQPNSQPQPQPKSTPQPTPTLTTPTQTHKPWTQLLTQHVSASGKVDYKGFIQSKEQLNQYLESLASQTPTQTWSRNEAMAYWINAYNAFTVKLIIDNWPVSSIRDIHNGDPWNVKWIELEGKKYSLNQIENDILRPRYGDARIHFAVNCAAKSCPPLLNRAFTSEQLNAQLDQQARSFINSTQYNSISPQSIQVSKIFDWYAADFGNLIDYLNQYSNTTIRSGAKVSFLEYDWGLND